MSQQAEQASALLGQWNEEFGKVMMAMADLVLATEVVHHPPQQTTGTLWWKQPFDAAPGAAMWVGAPEETWSNLGQRILTAAGIDSPAPDELKSTFLETVRQALGALAQVIGSQIGKEVACKEGAEEAPPADQGVGCQLAIKAGEQKLPPLLFFFNNEILQATQAAFPIEEAATGEKSADEGTGEQTALTSRAYGTLDLLMDVEMPVSISFGRTHVRIQDVLKLITGSIVELDRSIAEPVEVIVNNCVIARGEVVVIDGNYGVRITEVMSRETRLRESRRHLLPVSPHRH
jgi:flagellar motor switch protein FliN/FliY